MYFFVLNMSLYKGNIVKPNYWKIFILIYFTVLCFNQIMYSLKMEITICHSKINDPPFTKRFLPKF